MNIQHVIKNPSFFTENFVIQVQAGPVQAAGAQARFVRVGAYPLLFIQRLLTYVQAKLGVQKHVIDVAEHDSEYIKSQLEMTFLGQQKLYWLGNLSALPIAKYKKWLAYLSAYTGPHYVLFFSDKDQKNIQKLNVPEKISLSEYKNLAILWSEDELERIQYFAASVFKQVGTLTIDQAVTLTDYGSVLGSGRDAFVEQWLEYIVKPESSLFILSGALFAGKKELFFKEWQRLQDIYEFPFWLACFSEQFFRAYYYVQFRNDRKLVEAKKISFKLPFSFLQRDWQRYKPEVFAKVHSMLYALDGDLKNGGSEVLLERMFIYFQAGSVQVRPVQAVPVFYHRD